MFGTKCLFMGKDPLFQHRESFAGLREVFCRERRSQGMRKGCFLLSFCCSWAGYDGSDCKERPVWKVLCRAQELWAKFLSHVTACQLFSTARPQFVFCVGLCPISSAVSAFTDCGQTVSCCRSGIKWERAECKVQGSSLLLCLFVLSVALK